MAILRQSQESSPQLRNSSQGNQISSSRKTSIVRWLLFQVLLPVPLCVLRVPLSLQRAVQHPRSRHVVAIYTGMRAIKPAFVVIVSNK